MADWRNFLKNRKTRLKTKDLVLSEELQLFSEFVKQPALHAWVAAHIKREFPNLTAGIVLSDPSSKQLHAIAVPNSSPDPTNKWTIDRDELISVLKRASQTGESIEGFFSTRSPGKSPTTEELTSEWVETGYWVISTNSLGDAVEGAAYFQADLKKYTPITTKFALNPNAEIFAAETRIIASVVQTANGELMRWLQKHPNDLLRVHPGTFEQIVAELFRDQGFDVEVLGSWNQSDGGIDIIAIRKDSLGGAFRVGIQCKRYVKTGTVKADLIWALEGRLDKFHLHKGVLATTAHFEKSALSDLKDHLWRIELRDFEMLTQDLQSWGRYKRESTGLWLPK